MPRDARRPQPEPLDRALGGRLSVGTPDHTDDGLVAHDHARRDGALAGVARLEPVADGRETVRVLDHAGAGQDAGPVALEAERAPHVGAVPGGGTDPAPAMAVTMYTPASGSVATRSVDVHAPPSGSVRS